MTHLEGHGPGACWAVRDKISLPEKSESERINALKSKKIGKTEEESIMIPKVLDFIVNEFYLDSEEIEKCQACRESDCLKKSLFHSKTQPSILFESYIKRIFQKLNCSKEVFYLSFFYFDRLIRAGNFCKFHLNVHKVFYVAIMLAYKFLEDCEHVSKFYASIAGISPEELQSLEQEFLATINWRLYVDSEGFSRLVSNVNNLYRMAMFSCN